jgi:hypothetical protein
MFNPCRNLPSILLMQVRNTGTKGTRLSDNFENSKFTQRSPWATVSFENIVEDVGTCLICQKECMIAIRISLPAYFCKPSNKAVSCSVDHDPVSAIEEGW